VSLDTCDTTFGVRTLRWDSNRGFFLNGKALKIKGFANHEDHAGVGVAVPDALHEIRLRKLKECGCNAYPRGAQLRDARAVGCCDRLGLLVMAETRQAGSTPEALDNLERMIVRDRNHPSIILWSIGNEEHTIQWKPVGERIGRTMKRLVRALDPTRMVTAAMHDRSSVEGFMNVVDVHGWNYIRVGNIEEFRRANPKRLIVGSEECSVMTTRGVYADDPTRGYCAAYDVQTPKWGATAEAWWTFAMSHPWYAGGFALDRLRPPRRTDRLQVAQRGLPFRCAGPVRLSEGELLLLPIVVAGRPQGDRSAPVPALELERSRGGWDRRPLLQQLRRGRAFPERP
jgi:beta-galactosidase